MICEYVYCVIFLVNCLDRHVKMFPEKTAIIWEREDETSERISYRLVIFFMISFSSSLFFTVNYIHVHVVTY